jgi:hypothetical protein
VEILITGEPIQETDHPRELRPAPVIGADNAYVVCEILGYSAEELTAWQTQGVIKDYT